MKSHAVVRHADDLFPTQLGCYNPTRFGRPVPSGDDGVELFWLTFFHEAEVTRWGS